MIVNDLIEDYILKGVIYDDIRGDDIIVEFDYLIDDNGDFLIDDNGDYLVIY